MNNMKNEGAEANYKKKNEDNADNEDIWKTSK